MIINIQRGKGLAIVKISKCLLTHQLFIPVIFMPLTYPLNHEPLFVRFPVWFHGRKEVESHHWQDASSNFNKFICSSGNVCVFYHHHPLFSSYDDDTFTFPLSKDITPMLYWQSMTYVRFYDLNTLESLHYMQVMMSLL